MPAPMGAGTTAALTGLALAAFAANSLLARAALLDGGMDPAAYTGIRLVAGACVLAVLLPWRGPFPGSWAGAGCLLGYALAFSVAYVRMGAGVGALVLFVAVQATMLGWGAMRGQRPTGLAAGGVVLAFAGLVALLAPGLSRPDPVAAGTMALAGVAWGAYTVLGRGAGDPAARTAGNFVRTLPLALPLAALALPEGAADLRGVVLAVVSGALASGGGYVVWYRALGGLSVTQAASVQLAVPALAAAAAVVLLGEPASLRLVLAGGVVLAGVGLAVLRR